MLVNFSHNTGKISGLTPFKQRGNTLNENKTGIDKSRSLLNSLDSMAEFNKNTIVNFKGFSREEKLQRMADELYYVVDEILDDVSEITSIYKKGTRKFLKQPPKAYGREKIEIDGDRMIEYTTHGRRETVFKDKKPVKIVEFNEENGKKNIIKFKDGVIVLYQEGIKRMAAHYDEIEAEILFEDGEPVCYMKDIIATADNKHIPVYTYRPQ